VFVNCRVECGDDVADGEQSRQCRHLLAVLSRLPLRRNLLGHIYRCCVDWRFDMLYTGCRRVERGSTGDVDDNDDIDGCCCKQHTVLQM